MAFRAVCVDSSPGKVTSRLELVRYPEDRGSVFMNPMCLTRITFKADFMYQMCTVTLVMSKFKFNLNDSVSDYYSTPRDHDEICYKEQLMY